MVAFAGTGFFLSVAGPFRLDSCDAFALFSNAARAAATAEPSAPVGLNVGLASGSFFLLVPNILLKPVLTAFFFSLTASESPFSFGGDSTLGGSVALGVAFASSAGFSVVVGAGGVEAVPAQRQRRECKLKINLTLAVIFTTHTELV